MHGSKNVKSKIWPKEHQSFNIFVMGSTFNNPLHGLIMLLNWPVAVNFVRPECHFC